MSVDIATHTAKPKGWRTRESVQCVCTQVQPSSSTGEGGQEGNRRKEKKWKCVQVRCLQLKKDYKEDEIGRDETYMFVPLHTKC